MIRELLDWGLVQISRITHHVSRITYYSFSLQPSPLPGVTFLTMKRLLRRPWVIATLLVLGVLIAACILRFRSASDPAVVVVSAPNRLPAPKQPLWVLAEPDLKRLGATCLKIPGADTLAKSRISTADAIEASLFLGEVYVLSGVTNSVGVSFDCYPRVHRDMTDLRTIVTLSEALTNASGSTPTLTIQTNLDLTAKVQLQRGNGFFLLDSSGERPNGKPIGVIVTAKVPKK